MSTSVKEKFSAHELAWARAVRKIPGFTPLHKKTIDAIEHIDFEEQQIKIKDEIIHNLQNKLSEECKKRELAEEQIQNLIKRVDELEYENRMLKIQKEKEIVDQDSDVKFRLARVEKYLESLMISNMEQNKTVKEPDTIKSDNSEVNIALPLDFENEILEFHDEESDQTSSETYPENDTEIVMAGPDDNTWNNARTDEPTSGNPSRVPYTNYHESSSKPRNVGRQMVHERHHNMIPFMGEGYILNTAGHDIQQWDGVLEIWKMSVVNAASKAKYTPDTAEGMYRYLETYLGESAGALWEAFKREFPGKYRALLAQGKNPWNFVSTVAFLTTGKDPNVGIQTLQIQAIRRLEQLGLKDWFKVKWFLSDFYYYAVISGNTFNKEIGDKLFYKLSGALGREIHQAWVEQAQKYTGPLDILDSVPSRCNFVITKLEEYCTKIHNQSLLKNESFCKNIYTSQNYGTEKERRKKRHDRYQKRYTKPTYRKEKNYHIRKSSSKKPYLRKDKHVRRYYPERKYANVLKCFSCGDVGHFATSCPKKHNSFDKKTKLITAVNMDLVDIDSDVGSEETIYSIVSLEDQIMINQESEEDLTFVNNIIGKGSDFSPTMPKDGLVLGPHTQKLFYGF